MTARAAATWLVALGIALVLAGCADAPAVELRAWRLDGPLVAAPQEVTVPARLDVADRPGTYRLSSSVGVPPAWRGRPLTLWIPDLPALAALHVDGVAAASDAAGDGSYRARGPLAFPVPAAASADGRLDLAIEVRHRWTQSAWWSSVPRLTLGGERPVEATRVLVVNTYLAIAAFISLIQLGLTSLAIFLVDRHRRAYLWFSIQLLTAAWYPAHVLGWTQAVLGIHDTVALAGCLVSAIFASIWFTHEFFELGPPARGWRWLWGASLAAFVAFHDPFVTTLVSGPITIAVLVALTCYQLVVCGRLAWRHPDRITARFQLASWIALTLTMPPDLLHWLGLPTVGEGTRPASIGLLLFALCLSLLLSRRHILTLRGEAAQRARVEQQRTELEGLAIELRRQVAERSRQLFAVLAIAGGRDRASRQLASGDVVDGRYRVVRAVGRGGMGAVYEVERIADGRRLALKITHELHGVALARLAREALVATRIDHPNVVAVVDVSVSDTGFLYLVMELVDGAPLTRTRERWGDVAWALPVLRQIAEGLAALHDAGVVHRDLKPSNLLVTGDEGSPHVKITDFGIARPLASVEPIDPLDAAAGALDAIPLARDDDPTVTAAEATAPTGGLGAAAAARLAELERRLGARALGPAELAPPDPVTAAVTRTGHLVGTPAYIAPEVGRPGATVAPAADLFALGVIAFELCTGSRPFERPPVLDVVAGAAVATAPSLASRCPTAPPPIATIVDRCLALDPGRRPTAAEVAAALRVVEPRA